MATNVFTSHGQWFDDSGNILSGGKIYVYDVGTTTPKTLYSASDLSGSPAANPIVLDSAGRHDNRYIATGAYKVVVKTSADVTVFTRDNNDGGVPVGTGILAITNGGTGASSAPTALSNLGGATAAELADVAADVAALAGTLASTEATHIATGSTAQRAASPTVGDFRRNSTTNRWEGYNQSAAFEQFLTDTEIASSAEALAGTDNTKVMTPAKVKAANPFQSLLLHVRDEKASGTDGGTFTSGAWQTRTLNTSVTNEISGASLGSNQITLPSGTYYIEATAPARAVQAHAAKLRNTTDSTDTIIGTNENANSANGVANRSFVNGRFTIAAQKVFELQHRCGTTANTTGFGAAATFSVVEVYAEVRIWKVG